MRPLVKPAEAVPSDAPQAKKYRIIGKDEDIEFIQPLKSTRSDTSSGKRYTLMKPGAVQDASLPHSARTGSTGEDPITITRQAPAAASRGVEDGESFPMQLPTLTTSPGILAAPAARGSRLPDNDSLNPSNISNLSAIAPSKSSPDKKRFKILTHADKREMALQSARSTRAEPQTTAPSAPVSSRDGKRYRILKKSDYIELFKAQQLMQQDRANFVTSPSRSPRQDASVSQPSSSLSFQSPRQPQPPAQGQAGSRQRQILEALKAQNAILRQLKHIKPDSLANSGLNTSQNAGDVSGGEHETPAKRPAAGNSASANGSASQREAPLNPADPRNYMAMGEHVHPLPVYTKDRLPETKTLRRSGPPMPHPQGPSASANTSANAIGEDIKDKLLRRLEKDMCVSARSKNSSTPATVRSNAIPESSVLREEDIAGPTRTLARQPPPRPAAEHASPRPANAASLAFSQSKQMSVSQELRLPVLNRSFIERILHESLVYRNSAAQSLLRSKALGSYAEASKLGAARIVSIISQDVFSEFLNNVSHEVILAFEEVLTDEIAKRPELSADRNSFAAALANVAQAK